MAVAQQARADNVTIVSAGVAFFAFLSLFPALVALVSIYGLIADPGDVASQVSRFTNALPDDAQTLLTDQLHQVVASNRAGLSIGVVLGIVIALWGASTAVQQLLIALHDVGDEENSRGYVAMRIRAYGVTLAAIIFVSLAVVLLTVAPSLGNEIAGPAGRTVVAMLRWPLLMAFLGLGLSLLYRRTSTVEVARVGWLTWGAVVATLIWSVASVVFSLYATTFGTYNKTYGSLAAAVILMLWLFLTAYCVLLGAEVDAILQRDDLTS